ncbi:type II toxin-antitoxin system Phd/YefM family antitoxin [Pseudonocardia adelaidensis]|uniref:Antitoxin n=1 Tax=Pseudonocardia adelaidensis TaxID=648754 RepID=A0ABP9NTY4_9PSEU
MTEIALRELRNNTSEVLWRVEDGEEIDVPVNGRAVARLVPLPRRPRFPPAEVALANQADPGLLDDLREMLGDETTDDMKDPWERYEGWPIPPSSSGSSWAVSARRSAPSGCRW